MEEELEYPYFLTYADLLELDEEEIRYYLMEYLEELDYDD